LEVRKKGLVFTNLFLNEGDSLEVRDGTHAVTIVYLVKPSKEQDIKIDATSSDHKWINGIEEDLDPYIKQILKNSEVFVLN